MALADTATAEDLRRFQVEQREAGVPVPTMNGIVAALRFFFTHTLDRPDLSRRLVPVIQPRKLPIVLSPDEIGRLLSATTCLKHQAALSVAYGAGLRVAEVSSLKVSDIDSERMLRIERGKGGQYRNAMLSADMLALLREWWKAGRQQGVMHPKGCLFPGQHAGNPSAPGSSIGSSSRRRMQPTSLSGSDPIRCVTALRRTCWKTASTFASSRRCLAMPSSTTRRSIRVS